MILLLAADGSRVAIGAPGSGGNGFRSGHVRVFEMPRSEGWVQVKLYTGENFDTWFFGAFFGECFS